MKKFLIASLICLTAQAGAFAVAQETPAVAQETTQSKRFLSKKEQLLKKLDKEKILLFFVDPVNKKHPENKCENDACVSLVALIDNAQTSIDFAIYGIAGQDEVFNAILRAKSRGVNVRGVTDKNSKNRNPYPDTVPLMNELSTMKTDYKQIDDFTPVRKDYIQQIEYVINGKTVSADFVNKGIKDYNESIMHNKYFVFDNEYVYTGSMNVSSSCVNYNSNSSVAIKSKELAQIYTEDFEQMYNENKFHKEKTKLKSENDIIVDQNTSVKAFLLPENRSTYYKISEYIKNAQKYIYVPMFFFTHSKYPQDLIDAHNRGVDVRLIIDATSAQTGYSKHEIFRMAGIPVKIENWGGKMHQKSMIIDDEYILIGSMNFTSGAHYTNDENSLLIKNTQIAQEFKAHFEYLWDSIPDKWLTDKPKPESCDSYNSCVDGIDNDHDGLRDGEDPDCKRN
ncbi:MAG: phospholipase D-like domain-containing protein [Candidatus Gastranaerophilales bacterium]